ncbi:MAG: hypothetical protein ACYC61_09895 [Isosphaeraceae bacterium]
MGRFLRPLLAMMLALFARPGPVAGPPAPLPRARPAEDSGWYTPVVEHFRSSYDNDPANAARQTWDQYWGWVRSFYDGNLLSRGWSQRARWLVDGVRSELERERLRIRLNLLGRQIGAEWAKDYNVRKVTSAHLMSWGKRLEQAREHDTGDGDAFHRVIDDIDRERQRHMAGKPESSP